MSEQENITAASAFFNAWNAGDLGKATQYEGPDFMVEPPGAPGPLNSEQNRQYNENFLRAFPGSKFEILLTVVQGDYVVINWKATGKNAGPLQSPSGATIPPSGRDAVLVGSSTFLIKNGKIAHGWHFWDMASLLGQMGLLPPM